MISDKLVACKRDRETERDRERQRETKRQRETERDREGIELGCIHIVHTRHLVK